MQIDKVGMSTQSFNQHDFIKQFTTTKNKSLNSEKNRDEKSFSKEDVETVVEKLNEFAEPTRTNIQFKFHEDLNKYYVSVVNPMTDEVIKEIPPEKMLDMHAAMMKFMGILIDEKI